ncbi:hypothetical protein RhiirA4_493279 [Rhizophagus irregularis]|uniref:Uncharacterized protein n=1 Tax=Rhizophagus irregularis TaxID=588596 RepID=A0A2I1HXL8_9GLOM|nr:hypothetical protein RhiirA4_493279 [Rhizophagus irregularis]
MSNLQEIFFNSQREPSEHVQKFLRQPSRTAVMPEYDVQLWNTPITMPDTFTSHEKSTSQDGP